LTTSPRYSTIYPTLFPKEQLMKQIGGSITAVDGIRAAGIYAGIKAVETKNAALIVTNLPTTMPEESCNASERYGEVGCPLITR